LVIFSPAGFGIRQTVLPELLKVGVGQNEQTVAQVGCANFRR
jgi:hypothetical protein